MKTNLLLTLAAAAVLGLAHLQAGTTKSHVGTQLPELKLHYLGNDPVLTGKPLLVEFWATSCPSCRSSIPHLNELYRKFQPKGLEAVGITVDDEASVRAFTKDVPIDYPVGIGKSRKLNADFALTVLPHALLVDKTGRIIWEGRPMSLQESQLEELLK